MKVQLKTLLEANKLRYDIFVRLLAIEEYHGLNKIGWAAYHEMQNKRSSKRNYGWRKGFERLIESFGKEGFSPEFPILVSPDLALLDGSHRTACSIFFDCKEVWAQVVEKKVPTYTREWFVEQKFSSDFLRTIDALQVKHTSLNAGTIICGSKGYEYANMNAIVDSFQTIVRVNMLIHGCGYGERPSDLQVVNHRIIKSLPQGVPDSLFNEWTSTDHLSRFKEELPNLKIKNYRKGNHRYFLKILNKAEDGKKIADAFGLTHVRTGLGHVTQLIEQREKPFLIGFSVGQETHKFHQVNTKLKKETTKGRHSPALEEEAIKFLHHRGLLDASFCALKDQIALEFDESLLKPTPQAKAILDSLSGSS